MILMNFGVFPGPLVRLKNLLFNQETLLTIVQWVTEFWWAVLLMGIAFVIFMAVFIKVLTKIYRIIWKTTPQPGIELRVFRMQRQY